MCYAGGPYCDKPAQKKFDKALKDFAADPSGENEEALKEAKMGYLTSNAGIQSLRDKGKGETADIYARVRENMIARAQEEQEAEALSKPNADPNTLHRVAVNGHYHAKVLVANHPNASMKTLQHIVDNETEDDFRFAIARHPKATPEMVTWAAEHSSGRAKDLALDNPNIPSLTVQKIRTQAMKDYQRATIEAETVSPSQDYHKWQVRQSIALWRKAQRLSSRPALIKDKKNVEAAEAVIPRDGEYAGYYASTDTKHFHDKDKPGSQFTDRPGSKFTSPYVKNLNDVVALANAQRGSLDGDDREKLIKFGANPANLSPDHRYLLVQTPGTVGSVHISKLHPTQKVTIERTKEGAPCSPVAEVKEQPTSNFSVVIMGRPKGMDKDIAITAHPGFPAKSTGKGTFDDYEGKTISINHAMEIAGTDDISVNTRLAK